MKYLITLITLFVVTLTHAQESMNVELLYHWFDDELPASAAHANTYNEIWGYAAEEREYAIIGTTMGTHIFDITDLESDVPELFVEGAVQGSVIVHRDYDTYGQYLYAVSDEGPSTLQIIDLSNLPGSVDVVYDSSSLFFRSHNIFIEEDEARLYVCGGNQQMNIYSLEDPTNPTLLINCQQEIENWSSIVGYCHDIYVRNNIAYCNAEDALWVVDFSDIENPQFLGDLSDYIEAGYNHSGWLSSNGNYYALADETHGTRIKLLDVSDYSDISVMSLLGTESHPLAIAHNLIFKDDLLHVSYYHDGYQVWDTSDPQNPERVAYYDTSEEPHANNYRGAWGIYPFLPSGRVLVSDMQEGLFVFNVNLNTSMNEKDLSTVGKVFPNPIQSGTEVYIDVRGMEANARIDFLSMEGRMVGQSSLTSIGGSIGKCQIPNDLPSGIYLLRIFANDHVESAKVVVR